MSNSLRLETAGEAALIVYLAEESSPEVAARVQALGQELRRRTGDVLVDLIPSYASLLVQFDALQTDAFAMRELIRQIAKTLGQVAARDGALVELPVYYHPETGADLETLARSSGLGDWEAVARIHAETEYRVYAIGFAPGFAYLGDVDERIAAPRLATPRQRVPRGTVAIADRQTAVYPAASPGGWNLIGRSPLRMFDKDAHPSMPVAVGDRVKFVAISREEYLSAGGTLDES